MQDKTLKYQISAFLAAQRPLFTRAQWSEAYQSWNRGGNGWSRQLGLGGTDTQSAICWYQFIHKPGSKEWRPRIIILALSRATIDWVKMNEAAGTPVLS